MPSGSSKSRRHERKSRNGEAKLLQGHSLCRKTGLQTQLEVTIGRTDRESTLTKAGSAGSHDQMAFGQHFAKRKTEFIRKIFKVFGLNKSRNVVDQTGEIAQGLSGPEFSNRFQKAFRSMNSTDMKNKHLLAC